ncbi:MAG: redoxin domain-containing protein, partial [Pseudomonadota bacterium]
MKKYAFLALLFTLFLNLEVHAKSMARVNTKAPDFTLQDMNSKDVSLSSFAGKTVVLEWTNHD